MTEDGETFSELIDDIEGARSEDTEAGGPAHAALKKLSRTLDEFDTCLAGNANAIVNYGDGIVAASVFRPVSWSRRSIRSSPNDSSRNSKCIGPSAAPISCYRFESTS